MKRASRSGLAAALTVAALALAQGALAHHSFAMFDQTKEIPLKGVVREFQWTNPHAFIHLEVPNESGGTDLWAVELNSPNNLKRQGWSRTSLKPGDKVTLVLNPLKDGSKGGLFVSVTLPDGTVLGDATRAGRTGPINVPTVR
ncbi:MAG: DUF6152 family protein [Pseudomonadota bacterium]|jgi:hypothetical protein|nr:MAG: hypothetical protein DIU56_00360 [Pseudomonadota bacterium]